mmetsp:Transcript_44908/g.103785  ORF Transcript_44908/g.103785 Transcript_44908/m.103785 type:complete len:92 (+) Transcript_44908:403-678(+)
MTRASAHKGVVVCPKRGLLYSHYRLWGHVVPRRPTLASQELSSFAASRCMRCGVTGHINCGPTPVVAQEARCLQARLPAAGYARGSREQSS